MSSSRAKGLKWKKDGEGESEKGKIKWGRMSTEGINGIEGHKQKREREKEGGRLPKFADTVC